MIVRDGGAGLSRCLASVRDVADEIVVVDTGSRDDSRERAQAAGARVIERPWDDDFAAARNAGLEVARGEWILALDADEHFATPSPHALREALGRPQYLGYFLPVVSELQGGEQLDATILRLWRHSDAVRFRFPIHEQVLPDLETIAARTGQRFALLQDLRVLHDGYTPAAIAAHDKVARNLRLFEKAIALHPSEPYLWYKFADFLRGTAEWKPRALAAAEQARALIAGRGDSAVMAKPPYWSELLTLLLAGLLETGRRAEALGLARNEPPAAVGSPHYCYVAALLFEAEGWLDEALAELDRCVTMKRPANLTSWRPGIVEVQSETLRARILLRNNDASGALAACERALAKRPHYPAAIQLQADALIAAQRAGDALRLLMAEARAAKEPKRLLQQAGALLARLGRSTEARRCLELAERPAAV